jgi:hypothetical protein
MPWSLAVAAQLHGNHHERDCSLAKNPLRRIRSAIIDDPREIA